MDAGDPRQEGGDQPFGPARLRAGAVEHLRLQPERHRGGAPRRRHRADRRAGRGWREAASEEGAQGMSDNVPEAPTDSGPLVRVRRQYDDSAIAGYRVEDLDGPHWSDVSGGVQAHANRAYLCG